MRKRLGLGIYSPFRLGPLYNGGEKMEQKRFTDLLRKSLFHGGGSTVAGFNCIDRGGGGKLKERLRLTK